MYSERDYAQIKTNAEQSAALVKLWAKAEREVFYAFIGISILALLSIAVSMEPALIVLGIVAIVLNLALLFIARAHVNRYHKKQVIAEKYLAAHKYDFNIDKRMNKEI